MERGRVWGNIPVGVSRGAQGVVDVGTVLAGVYIVGGSVEVVGCWSGGCSGRLCGNRQSYQWYGDDEKRE